VERHGVRRLLIGTKRLPADVVRALHAFAGAHRLQLLELQIGVRPVSGNGSDPVADAPNASENSPLRVGRAVANAS
jgi:hypothetical protein